MRYADAPLLPNSDLVPGGTPMQLIRNRPCSNCRHGAHRPMGVDGGWEREHIRSYGGDAFLSGLFYRRCISSVVPADPVCPNTGVRRGAPASRPPNGRSQRRRFLQLATAGLRRPGDREAGPPPRQSRAHGLSRSFSASRSFKRLRSLVERLLYLAFQL